MTLEFRLHQLAQPGKDVGARGRADGSKPHTWKYANEISNRDYFSPENFAKKCILCQCVSYPEFIRHSPKNASKKTCPAVHEIDGATKWMENKIEEKCVLAQGNGRDNLFFFSIFCSEEDKCALPYSRGCLFPRGFWFLSYQKSSLEERICNLNLSGPPSYSNPNSILSL